MFQSIRNNNFIKTYIFFIKLLFLFLILITVSIEHLIINHKGEIMSVKITKANKSDLSVASVISKGLSGKLFGDKAYISKDLFHQLLTNGLRLFTNLRKDMKTYLLDIDDKRLLNKRSLIQSVFNVLKKHMHLEHTRHPSPLNFFVHIICFSF
ncbi:transposase [Orientia tsutsugamushi]|nr:transposase [Orientia tsutsugamushi]